jgi:hypothetical protein
MRTLRMFLAGTVILALLGGFSGAVVAQGDTDPMAPAHFTFTLEATAEPEGIGGDSDSFEVEVRGIEEVEIVAASDSRASGLLTTIGNVNALEVDDGGFMTAATSVRLVNDGGAWSGTGGAVQAFVEDSGFATVLAVLTGERDYEGLTLVLIQYYDDDAQTRQGVIVPTDKVPPFPDPIEPTSE